MEFEQVIKTRRSVRKYTDESVPDSVIEKALEHALLAPNSSNLQPWEFYWVDSETNKKQIVDACLFQGAATTAKHLIVAVSRIDTWQKHRDQILDNSDKNSAAWPKIKNYYTKIIPFFYRQDPLGINTLMRKIILPLTALKKASMRKPVTRSDLFEVVSKTTALACQNFMLSIVDQGYACCPMEGFDEKRVKKLLNLNSDCHVVMIISVGKEHPEGIWGKQFRVDKHQVIHKI
jgi:nitroreductase